MRELVEVAQANPDTPTKKHEPSHSSFSRVNPIPFTPTVKAPPINSFHHPIQTNEPLQKAKTNRNPHHPKDHEIPLHAPPCTDMMERSDGEQKPEEGGISGQDGNKGGENGSGIRSKKSVRWSEELVMESTYSPTSETSPSYGSATANGGGGSNPYVSTAPASSSSYSTTLKDSVSTVRDVLGRWGKKVGEATKKAENLAGNTWQHLKTAPSFADAAMGRIAQGTKVLAEGGYEKIFRHTFETVPEEQLLNSFACYLSTSAGPVMGVLYISTAKLAFCSDNPLSYKAGDKDEWSYYKVVIPLHQLKAVNPSTSRANPAEKFIQVISVDNHEFWYMSFLNYDGAVKCLRDALDAQNLFV